MIEYNKRFKKVHGFESKATLDDIHITGDSVIFKKEVFLNIKIFLKNLYFEIKPDTRFPIKNAPTNAEFWLYVFIDENAILRVGTTTVNPINNLNGRAFPINPLAEQLFFNRNLGRMYKWNGRDWIEFDAVIIAKFDETAKCVNLYNNISQAGITKAPFLAEKLSLDTSGSFIKVRERGSYSFLTENETRRLGFTDLQNITLETLIHRTKASTSMSFLTALKRDDDYTVSPASINSDSPAVALLLEDVSAGEECLILERGFFYNRLQQWDRAFNSPIFYDGEGKITAYPPDLNSSVAVQKVGYVVDLFTIYFNPEEKYILGV